MRKALVIGINDYTFGTLSGCISDANRMVDLLARNSDNTPNFDCKKLISSETDLTISTIKKAIIDLFSSYSGIALFYFAGHGTEPTATSNACLVTQDAKTHNEGVELSFLMDMANKSHAEEVFIILDCCYSGAMGNSTLLQNIVTLREGISVLASSHQSQVSRETSMGGVFTSIICDALEGGASDTLGLITAASIYSFADKLLGAWDQRPVFKTYVTKMIHLRKSRPLVDLEVLRKLPIYFKNKDDVFPLDPSYEPEADPIGHENEKIFADLQQFNRASLLNPIKYKHMYFAAIHSGECALTSLGKYYWKLAKEGKI